MIVRLWQRHIPATRLRIEIELKLIFTKNFRLLGRDVFPVRGCDD